MSSYTNKVFDTIEYLLRPLGPLTSGLDFGCGNGWLTRRVAASGMIRTITPLDIKKRNNCLVTPILYEGVRIPFDDRAFEIGYAIDVLHHCHDPHKALDELLRCSKTYFLMKDHTYRSWLGKLMLCLLDEIGNRRFGVSCPYRYQQGWDWFSRIEKAGFELVECIHPAPCHWGAMHWVNRFEFVALWKRKQQ